MEISLRNNIDNGEQQTHAKDYKVKSIEGGIIWPKTNFFITTIHLGSDFLKGPENLLGQKSVSQQKSIFVSFECEIVRKHWPGTTPVIGEKAFKNILIGPSKLS